MENELDKIFDGFFKFGLGLAAFAYLITHL